MLPARQSRGDYWGVIIDITQSSWTLVQAADKAALCDQLYEKTLQRLQKDGLFMSPLSSMSAMFVVAN